MDAEPSPESSDLEIITSSDLPGADGADVDIADTKADENEVALDASPDIAPDIVDDELQSGDANANAIELAQHNDEPTEAALNAPDVDDEAKDTTDDVTDDFVAINDPLNVTQETDLSQHNKTESADMFSFFTMPGAGAANEVDAALAVNEESPASKRAESMGGLHKLDIDDINLHNEDHARDSDEHALTAQLSELTDADQHTALAEYGDDPGVPIDELDTATTRQQRSGTSVEVPFEEDMDFDIDADDDDDDRDNDVHTDQTSLPGAAPTHVSRRSIHDLVNDELEKEIGQLHNQSTLGDVGAHIAAETMQFQAAMEGGMDYDMTQMNADVHSHSDDEAHAGGMASEQKWMDMAKTWMQKEREFGAQVRELEDELNAMDDEKQQMLIAHEKQLAQSEQEQKQSTQHFSRQLAEVTNRAQMDSERLLSDNQSMAADVSILRDELAKERERAEDLSSQNSDLAAQVEEAALRWSEHMRECPLLNSEVAAHAEEKRTKEISKYELGSQQMSQSVTQLIQREKDLEDEVEQVREENAARLLQMEQSNQEMVRLRELLDKAKATANRNAGALDEAQRRAAEEERRRLEIDQELQDLSNAYEMLQAFSNEQSAILEQAEVPLGVDPLALAAVKQKKSVLSSNVAANAAAKRNRSFGGMSEFVEHMRNLSSVSQAWKGAVREEDTDTQSVSEHSNFDDDVSIASNFTRWSFRRYHTHDATREFFFLLALCVKLSLAHKYGVSPDVAPSNDELWRQALAADVAFHEYPEFVRAEVSSLYEFKRKHSGSYLIRNVVITNKAKITAQHDEAKRMERLQRDANAQGTVARVYEQYTHGDDSVSGRLNAARVKRDRTYFSPNDDLFGGHTKVTTRANRDLNLRKRNSSQSSRHSKRSSRKVKVKRRRSREERERHREPGNRHDAQIHPLNDADGGGRRSSEKLDEQQQPKKRGYHLTKKSLEVLDPNMNPHI